MTSGGDSGTPVDAGELIAMLERFRRRCAMPAVGAALVTIGEAPRVAVVGQRVRGRPEPVTARDRWHIGSCAKAMTATLVGRLVDRGVVGWTATLPGLFPDLGGRIDPCWNEITLAQVLTHRAGLPANLSPTELASAQVDRRPLTEQRTAVVAAALSRPAGAVGRFCYSNLGYIVVGAAIERLTGMPYENALVDEVLRPLGVSSAGFGAPTGPHPWGHQPRRMLLSGGVGRGPAVDPTSTGGDIPDNPPVMSPAGRVHLALADWARFLRVFIAPDQDLLRPATMTMITTPAPGPGTRQAMGWASAADRNVAYGQQGSNRLWVATALVAADRRSVAAVVCNDGRTRLLLATARLATALLPSPAGNRARGHPRGSPMN